jgi:hypothetical protein
MIHTIHIQKNDSLRIHFPDNRFRHFHENFFT